MQVLVAPVGADATLLTFVGLSWRTEDLQIPDRAGSIPASSIHFGGPKVFHRKLNELASEGFKSPGLHLLEVKGLRNPCKGYKRAITKRQMGGETMNIESLKVGWRTFIEELQEERDIAKTKLDEADVNFKKAEADLATVASAMSILDNRQTMPVDSFITDADIQHCKTQPEAIHAYAKLNDGYVNVTKVSRLMFSTGRLTKGKFGSLKSTTSNYFYRNEDDWDRVEDGTFRLRSFQNGASPQSTQ